MLAVVVIFLVPAIVVIAAIRIVLGWTLPAASVARLDRTADLVVNMIGKLLIVAFAALIVALIVYAHVTNR